jgi:hypothetical protein
MLTIPAQFRAADEPDASDAMPNLELSRAVDVIANRYRGLPSEWSARGARGVE